MKNSIKILYSILILTIIPSALFPQELPLELVIQLGHSNTVESVAFSPDGKYALSGSWDQTLKLWDVSSGREIRTIKGHSYGI